METEYENYKKQYEGMMKTKLEARDLEIVALKDALFMRNQMIQRLDTTTADLNTELNDRENQLEERNISIQAIEQYESEALVLNADVNIGLMKTNFELKQQIEILKAALKEIDSSRNYEEALSIARKALYKNNAI